MNRSNASLQSWGDKFYQLQSAAPGAEELKIFCWPTDNLTRNVLCSASGEIIKFRRKTAVLTERRNWRQNRLSCFHWNYFMFRWLFIDNFCYCFGSLLLLNNMTDGSAGQPVQQAPNPNPEIFTGNIMNFEKRKFNAQQENRLEGLKCFKTKCGYIFEGSLMNISNERKCILVQEWLGPES